VTGVQTCALPISPGNHYWVDLAWTDAEYKPLMYANGVTVYFLTPVPSNPGYILP
jgi:hypothetical protein